jgi:multidrug efflux pump subunit AcrA (membrane-fusion protein)
MKVLLRTDAFLNQPLEGTVSDITPAGDPIAKTYRVKIALPDDSPLRIGMSVEANIVTREKADVLLAPSAAVVDGRFVTTLRPIGARWKPVSAARARSRSQAASRKAISSSHRCRPALRTERGSA